MQFGATYIFMYSMEKLGICYHIVTMYKRFTAETNNRRQSGWEPEINPEEMKSIGTT